MLIAASGGGAIIGTSRMCELPFWAVTKRWKDTLPDLSERARVRAADRTHVNEPACAVGGGSKKARSNTRAGTAKYNGN
jgi:hypothetical protein